MAADESAESGRGAGDAVTAASLVDGLNDQQRLAVEHVGGPLLILAGAGSGKTRVLTSRVAYLITQRGVRPEEVLAITFTNKAAAEMKNRIEGLVGPLARTMWIHTFHAMCARILRREGERLGYRSGFSIHDEDDRRRLIKKCLEELDLDPKRVTPESISRAISDAKNQILDAEAYAQQVGDFFAQTAAKVYALYEQRLMEMNAMDFDDLLMKCVNVLELFPQRLEHYQRAFRYILIDEYQDTNHAQYRLANLLAAKHGNLAVVGDDDQSIYSWRGADISNILDFERDHPDAQVIRLEQNYRSTQPILDVANAVVTQNRQRKGKNLWTGRGGDSLVQLIEVNDERAEAQFVASEVQKLLDGKSGAGRNFSPAEIAVLYRTNAQSRALEEQFGRYAIGYQVIGGPKFYQRAEIRDALAYLTVLVNADDTVRLMRVINSPKRGLGATSLGRVIAHADSVGQSAWETMAAADEVPGLGAAAVEGFMGFVRMIEGVREGIAGRDVADIVRTTLEQCGYFEFLKAQRTLEAEGREENLEEFIGVAAEYDKRAPEPTLAGFLQEISLYADLDDAKDTGELITLMTLHNAKGLEFPAVFVTGMEEGVFPHQRALDEQNLEEERRLAYVGITRAMDRLYLVHARARSIWGTASYNIPSRFIGEIPPNLLEKHVVGGPAAGQPGGWSGASRASGGSGGRQGGSSWGGKSSWGGSSSSGNWGGSSGQGSWGDDNELPPIDGSSGRRFTDLERKLDEQVVEQYFSTGERVLHATLGEGTVLALEGGGIVLVRFVNDGSERRLMASVAPLRKLRD